MKQLPNYLTFLRLILIPVLVVLMIEPTRSMIELAAVVFWIAAITDLLDGYLARKLKATSVVGKLLDPLADKLLVMAALVMLVALKDDQNGLPWVPAWMVVLVLGRELWVTGLRAVAASYGVVVSANQAGKVKSFLQMLAILLLILHDIRLTWFGLPWTCQLVGLYLLFISIAFSYWGAADYSHSILGMVLGANKQAAPTTQAQAGSGDSARTPASGVDDLDLD